MRLYTILFLAIMMSISCRQTAKNNIIASQTDTLVVTPAVLKENIIEETADYPIDSICTYEYKEPIHGYKIRGEIKKLNPELDESYTWTLFLTNIETGKQISVFMGLWGNCPEKYSSEYSPHHNDGGGIITAPDEDFFFADIDFDGTEEIITGAIPNRGKRGVGLFTRIYKITEEKAVDYTQYFQAKSDVFNHIEQYFFSVNSATKSIMFYTSDGIYGFGWDIYDYRNGNYVYRHNVHVDRFSEDSVQISIYPNLNNARKNKNLQKRFVTTEREFDKHRWEY